MNPCATCRYSYPYCPPGEQDLKEKTFTLPQTIVTCLDHEEDATNEEVPHAVFPEMSIEVPLDSEFWEKK